MTIEVPLDQLYALAGGLRATGETAGEVPGRLTDGAVGGTVQEALVPCCEKVAAAASFLAGELQWLATTIGAVADDWAGFDGSLLGPRGTAVAE